MLNLGYDMFDELCENMRVADRYAHGINCTRLSKHTNRDVEAVADIRFEIDETDVMLIVEYSYSDPYVDEYAHKATAYFKMNDDMELIWGIKQMERELSQVHSPASNIMNICTEVLKQVKLLKSER